MAEFHYMATPTNEGDGNYGSIIKQQPPQVRAMGDKSPKDGQQWINQHNVGTLNENRFTSLKPSKQSK